VPYWTDAWYNKGIIYAKKAMIARSKNDKENEKILFEEAVKSFDDTLKKDAKHYQALNNKALALYEMGDADAALASLDKAISVRPKYFEAYFNKGTILEAQGKSKEAEKAFEKAREIREEQ